MSITAETAKEHAKDPAVLCCRAEAGKVIAPDDLEDPAIFPDLEDSGLLEMPENTLTIEQVLGTTLKETTDALVPLTKELLDGVSEDTEEAAEEEAPVEKHLLQLLLLLPWHQFRQWADKQLKSILLKDAVLI